MRTMNCNLQTIKIQNRNIYFDDRINFSKRTKVNFVFIILFAIFRCIQNLSLFGRHCLGIMCLSAALVIIIVIIVVVVLPLTPEFMRPR